MRRDPEMQYRFSSIVRLGEGTGVTKLLTAIARRDIAYDPGVVMKNASTTMRPLKRRSQFRVTASNLAKLYDSFNLVNACETNLLFPSKEKQKFLSHFYRAKFDGLNLMSFKF